MRIGTSIFLIAVGAILAFAVTDSISGVELTTVGYILMVCGIIGLLVSLLYESMLRDRHRGTAVTRDRVVERDRF